MTDRPTTIQGSDRYQSQHQHLQQRTGHNGRAWLGDLRSKAMRRFNEVGFPTLKDEEWRYTNVKPIATTPFSLAQRGSGDVSADVVRPLMLNLGGPTLVYVDGFYRPELSELVDLPRGVRVMSLADAGEKLLGAHLGKYADMQSDPFTALNTAFIDDGAYVQIDDHVDMTQPIHLLFLSTAETQPLVSHVRNLIVAGDGSRATVVEHYVGLDEGVYWSNAVTEVVVGKKADIKHYVVERESEQAFNVTTLRVEQQQDSRFESHTALFGGAIVRNNIQVELSGEHCDSLVNGLYVGRGRQHMDNHMRVVHAMPNCDSRQFYKGVLDDHAHGVFGGRILVRPDAQKTDAKQTNRNLLLSDDAAVDTKPQLEIYADDVKCTHGATMGKLDEQALFYLMSRGIDKASAHSLLVYAFAHESLDRMPLLPVRNLLHELLLDRLAGGKVRDILAQPAEVA